MARAEAAGRLLLLRFGRRELVSALLEPPAGAPRLPVAGQACAAAAAQPLLHVRRLAEHAGASAAAACAAGAGGAGGGGPEGGRICLVLNLGPDVSR